MGTVGKGTKGNGLGVETGEMDERRGAVGEMDEEWGLWGKGRREGDCGGNGLGVETGKRDERRGLRAIWMRGGDCGGNG